MEKTPVQKSNQTGCKTIRQSGCRKKKRGEYVYVWSFHINTKTSYGLTFFFSILPCKVSGSYSLPCDFAAWDKNADGYVDLEEFSSVAYPFVKEGDLEPAFRSMDKDGMSTY